VSVIRDTILTENTFVGRTQKCTPQARDYNILSPSRTTNISTKNKKGGLPVQTQSSAGKNAVFNGDLPEKESTRMGEPPNRPVRFGRRQTVPSGKPGSFSPILH